MARRHQQLDDSLKLHQFLHDVEDEQTWMREREPLASDSDLGNTLTSVQILLKKHKVYIMLQIDTYFYIVFNIHYTILCLLSDIVELFLVRARLQNIELTVKVLAVHDKRMDSETHTYSIIIELVKL